MSTVGNYAFVSLYRCVTMLREIRYLSLGTYAAVLTFLSLFLPISHFYLHIYFSHSLLLSLSVCLLSPFASHFIFVLSLCMFVCVCWYVCIFVGLSDTFFYFLSFCHTYRCIHVTTYTYGNKEYEKWISMRNN